MISRSIRWQRITETMSSIVCWRTTNYISEHVNEWINKRMNERGWVFQYWLLRRHIYDNWQADSTGYVESEHIDIYIHHAHLYFVSTLPCKVKIFISETENRHENSNSVQPLFSRHAVEYDRTCDHGFSFRHNDLMDSSDGQYQEMYDDYNHKNAVIRVYLEVFLVAVTCVCKWSN